MSFMASNIVHSFEVLTSQLLGVKGDGWAVQGPLWIPELHSPQLEAFLEKASAEESQSGVLFAHVGATPQSPLQLILEEGLPPPGVPFVYIVKPAGAADEHGGLCMNSCLDSGGILGTLLHLLETFAVDKGHQSPGMVKLTQNELPGQLQHFKTIVMEARSNMKGQTLLYIPSDDLEDTQLATRDKALLRRLETTLLHWTSQVGMHGACKGGEAVIFQTLQEVQDIILLASTQTPLVKSVLMQCALDEIAPIGGALAEYHFWKQRTDNLQGLLLQVSSIGIHKIIAVLDKAESCYLHGFLGLSRSLKGEADVAAKTTTALSILVNSCAVLSTSPIKDLQKELPIVVGKLRVIRNLCPSYGKTEAFTLLSKRMSHDVVNACIRLPHLYNAVLGAPGLCAQHLQASISTVDNWRGWYNKASHSTHAPNIANPWHANKATVFSYCHSFLQRCRELLEICATTQQFANTSNLLRVNTTDSVLLSDGLRSVWGKTATILQDIQKSTVSILQMSHDTWKPVHLRLEEKMQELEKLFSTLVHSALAGSGSIYSKAYNIQAAFDVAHTKASLPFVRQCAIGLYKVIDEQVLQKISYASGTQQNTRRTPYGHLSLANQSGNALMSFHLARRLSATLVLIEGDDSSLSDNDYAKHAHLQKTSLQSIYISQLTSMHAQWYNGIQRDFKALMTRPILSQDKTQSGYLATNISPNLYDVCLEGLLWEQLKLSLPDGVVDIYTQWSRIHRVETKAFGVAHCYNGVMKGLSKVDKNLFHGRLRQLDRKVLAATTKLTLISAKVAVDAYSLEALKQCRETKLLKSSWSNGQDIIDECCQDIAQSQLSYIVTQEHVMDVATWSSLQASYQSAVTTNLMTNHKTIVKTLDQMHCIFATDGYDIGKEWAHLLSKVDAKIKDALSQAMHKTFSTFGKLLSMNCKIPTAVLFKSSLILANTARIEIQPGVQEIFETLYAAAEDCYKLAHHMQSVQHAHASSEMDEDNLETGHLAVPNEVVTSIHGGDTHVMTFLDSAKSATLEKIGAHLLAWERKYHVLWDQDKDIFMRRYEKANKDVEDFQTDVEGYRRLKELVLAESSIEYVGFLQVENHQVKKILVEHCNSWITKLLDLMARMVQQSLEIVSSLFGPEMLEITTTNSDKIYSLNPAAASKDAIHFGNLNAKDFDNTGTIQIKGRCKSLLLFHDTLVTLGGPPLEITSMHKLCAVKKWLAIISNECS